MFHVTQKVYPRDAIKHSHKDDEEDNAFESEVLAEGVDEEVGQ